VRIFQFIHAHLPALSTLPGAAVFFAIIVGAATLARRLKLPPAVLLLLAGLAIGPHALGLVEEHHPIADFLGEIGKLILMFSAELEVNLSLFRRVKNRALFFGLLTTTAPQLLGTSVGLLFGYPFIPAVVIGSLLGFAYPFGTTNHSSAG